MFFQKKLKTHLKIQVINNKNEFIFINTIDGRFYAVNKDTGVIQWSFKETSSIEFPKNNDKYFLN